ncbi:aldose epimerase family protein [Sphingomonas quercus]|uniref:Aldose 1-epimerase n=1 Tax=Sphingomonas quercus TaxID=2842451 RepID=A0ABS6BL72_9SPHN|nr:aldose epimerase family protein [Sphingomonas quercus]MBU3079051.1 galactose mutarotase [Sphingomonas quercus]
MSRRPIARMLLLATATGWGASALAASVTVAPYGTTRDGHAVRAFTLTNDKGASATILDYGGAIAAIRVPDRNGQLGNVVMSYADIAGWEAMGHVNSIIGRYANRIRKGFTLDGIYYPLQQQGAAGITLHGGPPAYSTRVWTAEPIRKQDGAAVTLTLDSPDGDQGFPGRVKIRATYRFTNDNALRLDFTATTDKPTLLNLTNHVYFNLSGNSNVPVYAHRLMLNADRVAVKDAQGMPSGVLQPVAGTGLDLSSPRPLSALPEAANDPIFTTPRPDAPQPAPGQMRNLDHSFVFKPGSNQLDLIAARLEDDASGRVMELRTTETSIQAYIPASSRPGLLSDVGKPFTPGPAIALETQHLPDSPNQPSFPSTVLRPEQTYHSTTIYKFGLLPK